MQKTRTFPLKRPISQPIDDDLSLYMPFQEGTGNIAIDLSGNSNHSPMIGPPTWSSATNDRGFALNFNGSDTIIDLPDTLNIISPRLTLIAYVRLEGIATDGGIIGKRSRYEIYYESSDNTWRIGLINASSVTKTASGGQAIQNVWTHVVGTYDGSFITCYVNGVAGTPVSQTGNIQSNTEISIGVRFQPATGVFNGQIKECRIYERVLTANEINRHYDSMR